jgi:hypothetical protein
MQPARSFFVALPAGLLAAVGGFAVLFVLHLGNGRGGTRVVQVIRDKKEAAAQCAEGPRILLVGGSATLFGVRAGQIEDATGVPSFNLAVHAGLGAKYALDRAERLLRPADTVILIPEYELYDCGEDNLTDWAGEFFIDYLTGSDPAYFLAMPIGRQFELAIRQPFRKIRKGAMAQLSPWRSNRPDVNSDPVYNADNVDGHGDLIRHHRDDKPAALPPDDREAAVGPGVLDTDRGGWPAISRFVAHARARGVRVLAAFPNVPFESHYATPGYAPKLELIRQFYLDRGVAVLGTPRDAMLPRSDFFDTVYHPFHEAATTRTARLIELLQPMLAKPTSGTLTRPDEPATPPATRTASGGGPPD